MPTKPIPYIELPIYTGEMWQTELVSQVYCTKCRQSGRPGIWMNHEWYDGDEDGSSDIAICIGCLTEAINELVSHIGG